MLHKSGIIILILLIRDHTNTTLRMMLQNRKRKSEHIFNQQKSRKNLTFAQKREICEKYCKKPKPSQTDLATEYCVRQSTISDILSNKDRWLSIDTASPEACKKKTRQAFFPKSEEALVIWVTQALQDNLTINGDIIKQKACTFRDILGIQNFKASDGWLNKSKKRHHICSYVHI